jgi:uncharacterized protein
MPAQLSEVEQRVLGCLIEKAMATPDHYPLTPNALVAACNQSSNRNPVVSYDQPTVVEAGGRLKGIGLARVVHSPSNRAEKYRHVVDEALGLEPGELAVLCELLVRGPQTPGELRARTERLLPDIAVDAALDTLAAHADGPLVERLDRQPGQREHRWRHLMGEDHSIPAELGAETRAPARVSAPSSDGEGLEERVAALEARLARLEAELGYA